MKCKSQQPTLWERTGVEVGKRKLERNIKQISSYLSRKTKPGDKCWIGNLINKGEGELCI